MAFIAICLVAIGPGSLNLSAQAQGANRAGAQRSSLDLSTPQKTLETFLAAIKKGDMETASKCVVNGKPIPLPGRSAGVGPSLTLSDTSYKTEGDKATYTGTGSIAVTGTSNTYPIPEKLDLKKRGEEWIIVAPDRPARGYLTQYAIMLGRPELLKAEQAKAHEISCLSNLRQIGTGSLMFLQDYQDKFALKAASYKTSLLPYLRNPQLFHCFLDKPGGVSYAFNNRLTGIKRTDINNPAMTVMVYEGNGGKLVFRHDGKAGVVFADGHAKMVTANQAKSLRWKP